MKSKEQFGSVSNSVRECTRVCAGVRECKGGAPSIVVALGGGRKVATLGRLHTSQLAVRQSKATYLRCAQSSANRGNLTHTAHTGPCYETCEIDREGVYDVSGGRRLTSQRKRGLRCALRIASASSNGTSRTPESRSMSRDASSWSRLLYRNVPRAFGSIALIDGWAAARDG